MDLQHVQNDDERAVQRSPLQRMIEYGSRLNSLSQDEIDALYAAEKEKEDKERYFNQRDAIADYVHWSQCAHWTLDEAIALSLGRDPRVVGVNGVTAHAAAGSPFAGEYLRRTDLVKRAREAGELFEPTLPGLFLTWAKRRALQYPKELEEALEARGHTVVDMKKIADDLKAMIARLMEHNAQLTQQNKRLVQQRDDLLEQSKKKTSLTKERQSLEKLVYGMANGGYKYDDNEAEAVKDICSDLDESGVPMDPGTVRKYLRAGADLRSRDAE